MNPEPLLKIENLHKEYADPVTKVLDGIRFEIFPHDFLCILGPSGCGKSTLIRCIAGFESFEGSIRVSGSEVTGPGPDRTMVFQDFNQLFPWRSVLDNIAWPLKLMGMKDRKERQEKARVYLDKVNLSEYRDYYPHQLSGGMKQRVAIARAMALGSKLILMDEPFAALDAITRNRMQDELLTIKEREGLTVIFITHNIQEAICLGNRIMVMSKDGLIREDMENTIEKPVTPASAGYGELWQHMNRMLREGAES